MKQFKYWINSVACLGMVLTIFPADSFASCKRSRSCSSKTVDYVVIGSCAGAVVAKKLSDDRRHSVLLLEAGDNNNTNPLLIDSSQAFVAPDLLYPEIANQGRGVIQPQLGGGFFDFGTARLLGGGSSHNGLQVVKGGVEYWQAVANIVGDDWSVDKVFARYKALETYQNDGPGVPDPTRGTNGPWKNVTTPSTITPDATYLTNALAVVSGTPIIQDYNNPQTPIGSFARWDYQEQFDNGYIREATPFAYLGPNVVDSAGNGVNGRKLKVLVRSPAIELLWDKRDSTKVIGVRYTSNGKCHDVFVRKEVIVSAGLYSASFLQLSGIGPKEVLLNAGIEPRIINENVGDHLTNHILYIGLFSAPGSQITNPAAPWAIYGPGAFLPTTPQESTRNFQFISINGLTFGIPDAFAFAPILLTDKSEGTIFIQDNDFTKIPLVNPNYLTNPADEDACFAYYKTQLEPLHNFFQANPAPNGQFWELVLPPPGLSRQEFSDFLRINLSQAFHYSCTTRMGKDILTSVVDSRGRVHGAKGLRVADVSILPIIPDGNTCTPAVLVGDTIAEFIIEDQARGRCRR